MTIIKEILIDNGHCVLVHLICGRQKNSKAPGRDEMFSKKFERSCWNTVSRSTLHHSASEVRLTLGADEMLFKARDVAAIRKPSDGDHRNVKQWLWDNKPLLEVGDEADFVNWRDDLVTLQPKREWAAIDGILFTLLRWFNVGFIQVCLHGRFCSQTS
jgi:hypothetical protein